ncbi:MAG: glycosyltransferase [Planctomycetota bacterium]
MQTNPEPQAAPTPRVLQLFNVFGAPTEQTWFDAVCRLNGNGFDVEVRCEERGSLAVGVNIDSEIVDRIHVTPTDDVSGQMQRLADTQPPDVDGALPDLAHGHFGTRVLHAAPYLQRGVSVVISLYGYDASRLLRDRCWVERYRWAAERGAVFVVLADSLRERLIARGLPAAAVRVVRLGVDPEDWRFDPEPQPKPVRFVFVGRLSPKKGVAVLLEALARFPDSGLDVVGDGPLRSTLEELCETLGLQHRVAFHGQLPRTRIDRYLRRATALVAPSVVAPDGDEEGTPVVLMEAQALGALCITTAHAGNPEVLPPGAQDLVVPEHDVAALAGAMQRVAAFDSTERETRQRAGRAWVEKRYALPRMVDELAALYREFID